MKVRLYICDFQIMRSQGLDPKSKADIASYAREVRRKRIPLRTRRAEAAAIIERMILPDGLTVRDLRCMSDFSLDPTNNDHIEAFRHEKEKYGNDRNTTQSIAL